MKFAYMVTEIGYSSFSYGNGVPTALRARRMLEERGVDGVVVVDVPLLSGIASGVVDLLPRFSAVLFADVCKLGQHPHAGQIVQLQEQGLLPARWRSVANQSRAETTSPVFAANAAATSG